MTDKPELRSYEDAVDEFIEIGNHDGLLIPADLADHPSRVMDVMRRYAVEHWGWQWDITNAGIDGPHTYVEFPGYMADPAEYRDAAVMMLRDEHIPPGEWETAVATLAGEMAQTASQLGGWRRSSFVPPGLPSGRYWSVRFGFVG